MYLQVYVELMAVIMVIMTRISEISSLRDGYTNPYDIIWFPGIEFENGFKWLSKPLRKRNIYTFTEVYFSAGWNKPACHSLTIRLSQALSGLLAYNTFLLLRTNFSMSSIFDQSVHFIYFVLNHHKAVSTLVKKDRAGPL